MTVAWSLDAIAIGVPLLVAGVFAVMLGHRRSASDALRAEWSERRRWLPGSKCRIREPVARDAGSESFVVLVRLVVRAARRSWAPRMRYLRPLLRSTIARLRPVS